MIQQPSFTQGRSARQSLLPLLTLSSLTLVGCGAFQLGGVKRSPNFATGNAPEPTIVTAVVPCVHTSLPAGSGETSIARFSAIERSQVKAEPVAVPRATAEILCTTVAASDNFHFKNDWNASPSLAGVMHELAQAHGAKSVAVPIIRLFAHCEQDTQTVKNANGATVGTVELASKTCREDPTKYVGLFIFREDGTLIYKSTQAPGNPMGGGDLEQSMVTVFQAIPASFSTAVSPEAQPAPDATDASNSASAAAVPDANAADDGKIETALGELDPKAPTECKTFVETVCHDSRVPAASRVATCSGYVATIKQLLKSKRSQAVQACASMSKSLSAGK